ncbi:MAG TPA: helix-turn-helix transcriptional regulator [Burkholderiaceae bacterium]|jgi:DNA-binding transcriptional ArsR family regulator|nr:helix-turn-helix transcriptional regulator [Burkholderiaceae bacterium]
MLTSYEPRLARVAAMIADPARSRMLSYLLAGHYASAGELAAVGSVSASTTSGHLAKLEQSGLISVEQRGRHRYFKLADADVAHALESLALVAERGQHQRQWNSPARQQLRYARRCYGHLAGQLGVALLERLLLNRRLEPEGDDYRVTDEGERWLRSIGLEWPRPRPSGRVAYACLDWSERRDHLGGSLAAALLDHFLAMRWLAPRGGASAGAHYRNRALRATRGGEVELLPHLLG